MGVEVDTRYLLDLAKPVLIENLTLHYFGIIRSHNVYNPLDN